MPFSQFFFEITFLGHTLIIDSMRIALASFFAIIAYIGYDVTLKPHHSQTAVLPHQSIFKTLFWINGACIFGALFFGKPLWKLFQEYSLISYVSYVNLVFISAAAFCMNQLTTHPTESRSFFWYCIAVGFGYMAIDELCEIHENIDSAIHQILRITESHLTDRIDDAIILIYLIIAGIAILRSRKTLHPYTIVAPILKTSIIYIILMIIWDAGTNQPDVLNMLIKHPYHARILNSQLGVVEELFKTVAEWMLCGIMLYCISIEWNKSSSKISSKKLHQAFVIFFCLLLGITGTIVFLLLPSIPLAK
ncbi:MAG: hypothetical protein H7A34_02365 [bacterium]|nr:hypothetical protein [bacterium]